MTTDYHTPWQDSITEYKAAHMNAPLEELDEAIGDVVGDVSTLSGEVAGKAAASHTHDDRYYTESELSGDGAGGAVHWNNVTNKPSIGTGDVVGPASNTDGNIPQWNGADSKTLKDGLTVVTTVGTPGADTSIPTEQAVREALAGAGEGDVTGPATHAASYVPQWSGEDSKELVEGFAITDAGKAILDDASAAVQRTTLGVDAVGVGISYQSTDMPAASGEIHVLLPHGITFPADLTGSVYYGVTNPTGNPVTVSFEKGGVEFGTLEVTSAGSPTFASAAGAAFSAGDRLTFVFPGAQDDTWAGVAITLKGVRS